MESRRMLKLPSKCQFMWEKNMRYAHFAEYAAIAYSHKTDMPKYHVEVSCQ